ncbi:hypothetical protein GLYMA_04G208100v4 [Glycine max]|uniref:Uncharacterized protein n=1 Tax=Glycine max TaxID=3847 RepID=I1JXX5_SOYBN|nr:uncharacterized protein LOC100811971 [Glycine max]XP_040870925.1 uncharacterized protein LOC100811971 [Glycine max]KAH1112420.1 hypothetical protein GYH30_010609 [Glycine max]KRH63974.1 hypothetical protein GLYMA_04G208100v4 [Glycine max]|eukprot:XP_003522472.2 uncharacterized protein LOC100811971 [Glycine max]
MQRKKERKKKMLPLKLVRSLVLGETINHNPHHILTQNHHHNSDDDDDDEAHGTSQPQHHRRRRKYKRPGLIFLPTKEIIRDTYRLATIARDLGLDLYPTPSLSHIIFSNPSSSKPSSLSISFSCSLQSDAVPIPFPSLSATPLAHLRCFLTLSPRAFKIVLFNSDHHPDDASGTSGNANNWDCGSFSLHSRAVGVRVDTMEEFCRILAGKGWSFYKTKKAPSSDQRHGGAFYLFRRVDVNRVRVGGVGAPEDGACRVRELRLPHLDFGNAPLRILQYILLMTDDIFCLA